VTLARRRTVRIVVFTNAYRPTISGVVTSIELLHKGLAQAGHDVHIVAPRYSGFTDRDPYVFRLPSVEVPGAQRRALALPLKAAIRTAMYDIKPTVIHSQHPVWMGDLAASYARDLGVPLVFTFHTRYRLYTQQYVPIAHRLAGAMTERVVQQHLGRCAHVIAPTASIRDLILDTYALSAPLSVVPTPVDLSAYHHLDPVRVRSALGLEDAEVLLYVGRLAEEKNLGFLLCAFAQIVAQRPDARLLLAGRGPSKERLKRQAEGLGLSEHVLFAGAVPRDEVPHYAALADLFVFPSLTDTQGLVLIEAMAAGTPVVAVDAPGSKDVLAQGGGVLVPPREQDFTDAVVELLCDPLRRRALGRAARQVAERYSVSSATSRLVDVYAQAATDATIRRRESGSRERAARPRSRPRLAAWLGSAWPGLSRQRTWTRSVKR
jgi:glycosyltransferase involved in cell wall biosynthesis